MTAQRHTGDFDLNVVAEKNLSMRTLALERYAKTQRESGLRQSDLPLEESTQTIRELRIHQIELEMQNDELRRSQIALEESRARFRDLYDNAPVGYCFVSPDGLIHDANCTLGKMLGYPPSSLNQERFCTFIGHSDQDTYYKLRRRILTFLQPSSCELQMRKGDGGLFWVQLSVTVASVEGERIGIRVAVMDIDTRVRAEAAKTLLENQLRESQKMEAVGTLAGGIAHDFNNILTVISANSESAIRLTSHSTPTATAFIGEIQKATARARDLVNQILAFCRRQPTDRQAISVSKVIEESIGLLRSTLPANFSLKLTCDPCVPDVYADCTQIEQIVLNLATNAMQAMNGKPGQLRIHVDTVQLDKLSSQEFQPTSDHWRMFDAAVRVAFSDDGPGMHPAVAKRIFEPFFTTKPVNEGTGLGLAVVQGIVRAHDGEIFVKTQEGHGTTFTIYLPPAAQNSPESSDQIPHVAAATNLAPVPGDVDTATLSDCNILYLDDDPCVLKSIVRLLGDSDFAVSGYTDPEAAFRDLQRSPCPFKILITDYNMPVISGLEFAKRAKQLRPDLPVVITSGFIDEKLRSQARDAGVIALLEKPFSSKSLIDLISQIHQGRGPVVGCASLGNPLA